jgi:hypothetical protein
MALVVEKRVMVAPDLLRIQTGVRQQVQDKMLVEHIFLLAVAAEVATEMLRQILALVVMVAAEMAVLKEHLQVHPARQIQVAEEAPTLALALAGALVLLLLGTLYKIL